MTRIQWLICAIAAIGFTFDIYELLMMPLVVRPALMDLAGLAPGTPEFAQWVGRLFYVPALAGGVFGLLGGYLTDRLGRRRVLTWSILVYAVSAFLAGFSTSLWMLLALRCATFVGVCVEFVAAVAWLAELFDDPKRRERVLGYTQAFSSTGGLLVAFVNGLLVDHASKLPPIVLPAWMGAEVGDPHAVWRYTLMSGLIPAIPLLVIRPFLPESPAWERKRSAGQLRRANPLQLFAPALRRTTIVTTLSFACSYGAAFGALQMIPQMVPGLAGVAEQTADEPLPERKAIEQRTAARVTQVQELGGLAGRLLLAALAVRVVARRRLLRVFQLPGLVVLPVVFAVLGTGDLTAFTAGVFFAGLLVVGQFSFFGNYLPRVYPLHLRGTGEGVAANIGGRMIGTSFAWVTSTLAVQSFVPGDAPPERIAYVAAAVAFALFAAGLVLSFWLPEPGRDELPG